MAVRNPPLAKDHTDRVHGGCSECDKDRDEVGHLDLAKVALAHPAPMNTYGETFTEEIDRVRRGRQTVIDRGMGVYYG